MVGQDEKLNEINWSAGNELILINYQIINMFDKSF